MKIIGLSINLDKIDKSRIITGKKGKYINLSVIINDQKDQYGNDGFVSESVSKEEREAGKKGTILGNCKVLFDNAKGNTPHTPKKKFDPADVDMGEGNDDLPF